VYRYVIIELVGVSLNALPTLDEKGRGKGKGWMMSVAQTGMMMESPGEEVGDECCL